MGFAWLLRCVSQDLDHPVPDVPVVTPMIRRAIEKLSQGTVMPNPLGGIKRVPFYDCDQKTYNNYLELAGTYALFRYAQSETKAKALLGTQNIRLCRRGGRFFLSRCYPSDLQSG